MRTVFILIFSSLSICLLGQALLPKTNYKYKNTQQLIRKVAITFGNNRPEPRLTMPAGNKSRRIAEFTSLPVPELIVDEKLYDICRKFGPDSTAALAVIIGHELTHYYNRHTEWMGFAQMAANKNVSPTSALQSRSYEIQADMQGLYQAHIAGYDAFKIATPLYLAIYQSYQLSEVVAGYPSRKERLALLANQISRAKKLAFTFDTGTFLLLRQDYSRAEGCFNFIATEIPAQEVLTNLGLCQVWQATDLMTLSNMPFRYPFELAIRSRLNPTAVRGNNAEQKEELLQNAAENFRKAWQLDPGYETAGINLAATQSLLNRNGTALETLNELEKVLTKDKRKLSANARLMRGIILTKMGDYNAAKPDFEQSDGAFEILYNRALFDWYTTSFAKDDPIATEKLKNWVSSYSRPKQPDKAATPETKAGDMSLPFSSTIAFDESFNLPHPDLVRAQSGQANKLHYFTIHCSDRTYQVIQVLPENTTALLQKGLKNGSRKADFLVAYGPPDRMVSLSGNGTVYAYDRNRLFVVIRDGIISSWMLYQER